MTISVEDYLESIESEISRNTYINAARLYGRVCGYFLVKNLELQIPDACIGENDNLMYVWETVEHYLESEIFNDGKIEWFYRNKNTEENWGTDNSINEDNWSEDIWFFLSLFLNKE